MGRDRWSWTGVGAALAFLWMGAGAIAEDCTVKAVLLAGETELADCGRTWMEVPGREKVCSGDELTLECDTEVKYTLASRGEEGVLRGPEWERMIYQGEDRWEIHFAPVVVRFVAEGKPLENGERYAAHIEGWGRVGPGEFLPVPPETEIQSLLISRGTYGAVQGAYQPRLIVSGEEELLLEFATVEVALRGGEWELEDRTRHAVHIREWGTLGHGDVAHLPPDLEVLYFLTSRGSRGVLGGPDQSTYIPAGRMDWRLEFAQVELTFSHEGKEPPGGYVSSVDIHGWGDVRDGEVIFLPAEREIDVFLKAKADEESVPGTHQTISFGPGENKWVLEVGEVDRILLRGTLTTGEEGE